MEQIVTKPKLFGDRLRKYVLLPYYLDVLSKKGTLKHDLLKVSVSGYEESILNKLLWSGSVNSESPEYKYIYNLIEKHHREEIEEYLPILYCQSLVMVCSIFEQFLCDSLKCIFMAKPRVLHKILEEKYKKALNIETECGAVEMDKMLGKFERVSVLDKISFLEGRVGLNIQNVFDFKHHTVKSKIEFPDGRAFLNEIYKKRNDIVHRDLLNVKERMEMDKISTFIEYLMLDFAGEIKDMFGIPVDFYQFLAKAQAINRS